MGQRDGLWERWGRRSWVGSDLGGGVESGLKLRRSNNAVKAFLSIVNIPKQAADEVISGERCPRSRRVIQVYAAVTKLGHTWDLILSHQSGVRARAQLSGPQREDPWETFQMMSTEMAFLRKGYSVCLQRIDRGLSSEPEAWLRKTVHSLRAREWMKDGQGMSARSRSSFPLIHVYKRFFFQQSSPAAEGWPLGERCWDSCVTEGGGGRGKRPAASWPTAPQSVQRWSGITKVLAQTTVFNYMPLIYMWRLTPQCTCWPEESQSIALHNNQQTADLKQNPAYSLHI